jgi:RNA polymerase sigma factor (sigma-70 family)
MVKRMKSVIGMKALQPRHTKSNALYEGFATLPAMTLQSFLERLYTDNDFHCAVRAIFKICGHEADDAFHDFITRLSKSKSAASCPEFTINDLRAWLYRSALNARNLRHRRTQIFLKHWGHLAGHTARLRRQAELDPAEQALVNELTEAFQAALAELSSDERELLVSRYDGESYESLSQRFGKKPHALRAKLQRIRNRLYHLLQPYI